MPIVPIRPDPGLAPPTAALKPPDPNFLLMAAAQMHSEGRLIKSTQQIPMTTQDQSLINGPPTSPPGYEEWQSQGQSDIRATDEPPQADQIQDIMRHLGLAKRARDLVTAHQDAAAQARGDPWGDNTGTRI